MGIDIKSSSRIAKTHTDEMVAAIGQGTGISQGFSGGYTTSTAFQKLEVFCQREQGVAGSFFSSAKGSAGLVDKTGAALAEQDRKLANSGR